MAIILCASGFQLGLYAQQAAKLSPKVVAALNAPLVELNLNSEIERLRYNKLSVEIDLFKDGAHRHTQPSR